MMNCWKSVNINKEFGLNRVYIMSILTGLLSFLILYLPFSMIHATHDMNDHGFIPLLVILFFLPSIHRLMHMLPLMLSYKRLRVHFKFRKRCVPTFSYQCKTRLSKPMSMTMALAPTFLITVPTLVMSYVFPNYFAYLVLFASVNIGLSFSDFLYVSHFAKAPKKCIIENAKDGYDILIHQPKA
ncbi:DUF3267 domain-containing protein [Halobacillus kuroshimensis]|uniref:DUF3267 domain-containing protein n=1 Tax=Halobacillus kuroshimensis TaxID=302481 RepID=A0ABS3DQM7_9BACI|nr:MULTISPECIES: DUF3267 domain-containing protein [Halobacillus]MBN8233637.1 DUF3267 domain-containing protein [Halobacillus kuroshimensis]